MSEITIFGPSVSSYVRTVRLACEEKGVPHVLKPVELGSQAHTELHPFRKVPVMEHDGLLLQESLAIVNYIDAAFGGPELVPTDAKPRAEASKWVSYLNAYLYKRLVADYCLKYALPKFRGEEPNRAEVEAGLPGLGEAIELLENGLGDRPFFAGDGLSIADLFVAPALAAAAPWPEAAALLEGKPGLRRYMRSIESRDSWTKTAPSF